MYHPSFYGQPSTDIHSKQRKEVIARLQANPCLTPTQAKQWAADRILLEQLESYMVGAK